MISVCTVIADAFGMLQVPDSSKNVMPPIRRNVYVEQTIGGEVAVSDYGLALGGDPMSLFVPFDGSSEYIAARIGSLHSDVTISYLGGFYQAAVSYVEVSTEEVKLNLIPTKRII